jgi:GntR family transcriptional repressor for pyruvate dehydrogenase complex
MFKTVGNRSRLSKTVETQIEEAIRTRKLQSGTKLPTEFELCDQFGVSRTVIREALRTLSAKGYISVIKGKGIYVSSLTSESVMTPLQSFLQMHFERSYVLDIIHARQIIEPSMAALAAENHSKEDIAIIKKNIQDLNACQGDFTALAKLDMSFHLDIARASHNPLLPLLLEPIHRLMPNIKVSIYSAVKDAKESAVEWHEKIYEAIASRKPEAARRAMIQHLEIAEKHAEKMLKIQAKLSSTVTNH